MLLSAIRLLCLQKTKKLLKYVFFEKTEIKYEKYLTFLFVYAIVNTNVCSYLQSKTTRFVMKIFPKIFIGTFLSCVIGVMAVNLLGSISAPSFPSFLQLCLILGFVGIIGFKFGEVFSEVEGEYLPTISIGLSVSIIFGVVSAVSLHSSVGLCFSIVPIVITLLALGILCLAKKCSEGLLGRL
jgi:hypothetical protein